MQQKNFGQLIKNKQQNTTILRKN